MLSISFVDHDPEQESFVDVVDALRAGGSLFLAWLRIAPPERRSSDSEAKGKGGQKRYAAKSRPKGHQLYPQSFPAPNC